MVAYPLKVSTNGRYLTDQSNVPFLIVGDSAWSLESQLTNAQIDTYLTDRAARGFNTVLLEVIEHKFADHAPSNIDNVSPWTGATFTTPNNTYFNRIDHILTTAASLGICCILFPLYLGTGFGNEGWATEVAAASTADMQSWADFLATRYGSADNLIWSIGGDVNPSGNTTVQARTSDFATRLAASDTRHLITAHNARGTMGQAEWTSATWLTLNSVYTDQLGTPGQCNTAYALSGPLPFFQVENYYEHEHSTTNQQQRSQFYWTLLSGGCGGLFGNDPLWYFGTTAGQTFADAGTDFDWTHNLNTAGANGRTYAGKLFTPRQWYNLAPDSGHSLVTSGYGTLGSSNYVTAAQSADKKLAMAYMPVNATLTVDMSKLQSVSRARWFDPSNGTFSDVSGSPFANDTSRNFTPSATNSAGDADWVLILEALDPGMPANWVNY